MPKKKKLFNKDNSVTFQLVHRSLKDPLALDENAGQRVLQQVATKDKKQTKSVEEHQKYGIYFDDDYDYMQHLRGLNEPAECELENRFVVRAPKISLPTTLFETQGEVLSFDEYNPAAKGVKVDADVAAALEGDFDFANPEGALEDDFVLLANEGELPSAKPPVDARDHPSVHEARTARRESSSSEESDLPPAFDIDDEEELEDEEDEAPLSCARPGGAAGLVDEQFEKLCDEYDDDDADDSLDEEEVEGIEPDSHRILLLAGEMKNAKCDLVLKNDEVARRFTDCERLNASDGNDSDGETEYVKMDKSKKLLSNVEEALLKRTKDRNQPGVIVETSVVKPRLKNQQAAKRKREVTESDTMECDSEATSQAPSELVEDGWKHSGRGLLDATRMDVGGQRKGGRREETLEEKKARKKAVKEQRRERRVQKKCRKLEFKEAHRSVAAELGTVNVKTVPIA